MSSSSLEESSPSSGSLSSSSPPSNSSSDTSSSSSSSPPSNSISSSSSSPPSNSISSSSPPPPSPDGSDNSSSPPPYSSQDSQSNDKSGSPPSPQDSQSNNKSAHPPSDGKSSSSPPPPSSNKKSPSPPKSSYSLNKNSPPPPLSPPPPPLPPPPPSHSRRLSPPKHHKSPPPSKTSNGDSSSNQTAIITGIVVGATLLLFMMIAFVVTCSRKKKRKFHNQMNYYRDQSQGQSDYYNSGPIGNWGGQSNELAIKMPPSGQVSSEYNWPIAPPPPPPMMSSSEMSSASFSGPYLPPVPPPHPSTALGFNQSSFSYEDLEIATGNFCRENLLGQGGFGFVHKGVLPNGKKVAVKSLKANSRQGEREFQAEVDIISRVHHRHLVSLVGYCIAGSQRILVYEFVPNNTLEYHLHGPGRPVMDWPTRLKIALGTAKGFAYLHEDCHPRIIHRDIKVANILLDFNFEAKVADFGLAKLSSDNYTHVSTRIMGTFGYLAPEYASSGKLTEKSDVYSYGIMLLELITGRCPVDVSSDDDSLVDWARPLLMHATSGGSYEELVDPRLEHNYDHHEMLRMIASAGSCIRHSARRRPRMSQIVRALEGDVSLDDQNDGMKYGHNAIFSSGSYEYDGSSRQIDMKKFRKSWMSSQEFTSSEHGTTGEFVHSGGESQEHGIR